MFTKQSFPLENTALFDPIILDYLSGAEQLKPFYTYTFDQTGFESIIRQNHFASLNRIVLVNELKRQAELVDNTSPASFQQIERLSKPTTYTITTGHQLCLFTGPLYFVYKILSVINLCETLKLKFPQQDFVPVYWMASEDHDFAEVNHAHVFGKTITWNTSQTGSVGDFKTAEIQPVLDELKQVLGTSVHADEFMQMVEKAYTGHHNLSDATRYLVNALFGAYGLVVADGDSKAFKQLFQPEFEKDIFEQQAYSHVNATNKLLEQNYKVQVNPREINVFYKTDQVRERLVNEAGTFNALNTDLSFDKAAVQDLIDHKTEQLSPNVVLRPLYQQKILPNIAYVGGPGELAYWLEFKNMFDNFGIQYPVLVPRQFVTVIDKGTENKLQKLKFDTAAIFKDAEELVKEFVKNEHAELNLDGTKKNIETVYEQLLNEVLQIDKSLQGSVEAEKQKALNGLAVVEQKLNRALKQKSETDINQIRAVKSKLFPGNVPQERFDNLSMYYSKYGKGLIDALKLHLTYNLQAFDYVVLKES